MRTQHYEFAHVALPYLTHTRASQTLAILAGPDSERYLNDLWHKAGEQVGPEGVSDGQVPRCVVSATGSNGLVAAFHMPPPQHTAEAYLAVIIARFDDPSAASLEALRWVRYFTLERGTNYRTGETCSFVCEWTADGRHRNLGLGPPPEERAFVEYILQLLHANRD